MRPDNIVKMMCGEFSPIRQFPLAERRGQCQEVLTRFE